jgi:hypothetical protein
MITDRHFTKVPRFMHAGAAGDTDYNATPAYPNKTPEDAGEAAMAASKAPHPSGRFLYQDQGWHNGGDRLCLQTVVADC